MALRFIFRWQAAQRIDAEAGDFRQEQNESGAIYNHLIIGEGEHQLFAFTVPLMTGDGEMGPREHPVFAIPGFNLECSPRHVG